MKQKGQGAIEYLLLIGGAVLIAAIVIALMIGMGVPARDSVQKQSDTAQSLTDLPQQALINSVVADIDYCLGYESNTKLILDWLPVGEGTHQLFIEHFNGNSIISESGNFILLEPSELNIEITNLNLGEYSCNDTYILYIKTTKGNASTISRRHTFSWS